MVQRLEPNLFLVLMTGIESTYAWDINALKLEMPKACFKYGINWRFASGRQKAETSKIRLYKLNNSLRASPDPESEGLGLPVFMHFCKKCVRKKCILGCHANPACSSNRSEPELRGMVLKDRRPGSFNFSPKISSSSPVNKCLVCHSLVRFCFRLPVFCLSACCHRNWR